jgi:NAD(P) transhydrogenase
MEHYDVIVIGSGPAGQKAAIKCAKVGRRVAIIDEREVVGGRCLHIGTIPSKTLRAAIIYLSGYYERKIYGEHYRVKSEITVEDLLFRTTAIIKREMDVIQGMLARNGIDVVTGHAAFTSPHELRVISSRSTLELSGDYILICTGSVSNVMAELPFDGVRVMNTDDIMELKYLPKKLMVVGGGVIGLEYASMFSLLDMEVMVISQHERLLPFVDQQVVQALMAHMRRHGVSFHLCDGIAEMTVAGPRRVTGKLNSGELFDVGLVLYAAPRWGNTADLNLEAAGLCALTKGYLKVNDDFQTEVEHIYAAGDVIGFPSLASTSIDQGRKAANRLLGVKDVPSAPVFPYGIYTFPDISMAGASEEQLQQDGRPYEVGIGHYYESARGQIIGDEDGLVKLLFDPQTRLLLGVHIIGSEATELIHIGQSVIIHGGQIDYFLDTVFNYPTLAECYKIAAFNGFSKLDAALPQERL